MYCLPTILFVVITITYLSSSQALSGDAATVRRHPIGRVSKLDRTKLDRQSDNRFYATPNLVVHADGSFLSQLTGLYDELIPENSVILDIMSSHVSHIPTDKPLQRLDVHGMNKEELDANKARRATNGKAFTRNLNEDPSFLDIGKTAEYDAVLCCVGVQYLEEPEAVFAEVARILKPEGLCIVSFTNRFFYQKALTGWIERGMSERARLVMDYLRAAGGFQEDSMQVRGDGTSALTQLMSLGGLKGDPFVAVVARRDGTE